MADYEFPADTFEVPGDPVRVRSSAAAYGRFSTLAGESATRIGGQRAADWIGPEGDLFRGQVAEIPPKLDKVQRAYAQVAQALGTFAGVLEAAKKEMGGLRDDAATTFQQLVSAKTRRDDLKEPSDDLTADPNAESTYQEARRVLDRNLSTVQTRWDGHLGAARGIRARVDEASRTAGNQINAAANLSPTRDPGLLDKLGDAWDAATDWVSDRWDDVKNFVAEHADVIRAISGALKLVAGICAVLSFVPVVGAFFGAVALVTGGLAIGLDVLLKLSTGEGSWWSIGRDALLTLIPGGRITRLLGAPLARGANLFGRMAPGMSRAITGGARAFSGGVQRLAFQGSRLLPSVRRMEGLSAKLDDLLATPAGKRWLRGFNHGTPPGTKATEISRMRKNIAWAIQHGGDDFAAFQKMFSPAELRLLAGGKSITRFDPLRMRNSVVEFSHEAPIGVERALGLGNHGMVPRWPSQHAIIDPVRAHFMKPEYLTNWLSGRLPPSPFDAVGDLIGVGD